ncbi:hypothetical protein CSX04_05992 [Burkholderia cepacia]|nr:hypothetical protein CSX04_05992 [Burkholderia cepacia]
MSYVTDVPAADSPAALAHFEASLRFETDCWDVRDALASGAPDFVLLDVRGPDQFAAGHVPARATCRAARSSRASSPAIRPARCSSSTARARTATAPRARRSSSHAWAGRSS